MLNILTEAVIRLQTSPGSQQTFSMPEVYAALMVDEVEAFPALRPHQRHAWHAFLVQLGAMAMYRANVDRPPEDAEKWSRLIRALTPDYPGDEPWQLVVDDITRPAFMQPPASSKELEKDYKSVVETPDDLDIILMSKNHDLKSEVATRASLNDWIFALITLQTMEGFSGAGNYGISRMNGGLGSRAAFTLAPSARPGAHVRRDIQALLEHRPAMLAEFPMTDGAAGLLWTMPWDGTAAESLTADRLEPYYIEVCRRIRLRRREDGTLYGIRASSKSARIEGKELKGRTGDPWVPVNRKRDNLPLTLAAGGFTYKRVTEYLSSEWGAPPLLRPRESEQDSSHTTLVARAMVRGQGKTEGYHERIIPLRPRTVQLFGMAGGTQAFGDIARERVEQVSIIQRILSHAIQVFAARGDAGAVSTGPWPAAAGATTWTRQPSFGSAGLPPCTTSARCTLGFRDRYGNLKTGPQVNEQFRAGAAT